MDGDTAFFLHNRLIFKRVRPFQILFQPAQNDIVAESFQVKNLSALSFVFQFQRVFRKKQSLLSSSDYSCQFRSAKLCKSVDYHQISGE